MTFRERLMQEKPTLLYNTGECRGCPWHYGYEVSESAPCNNGGEISCTDCWDREMPEEKGEITMTEKEHEEQMDAMRDEMERLKKERDTLKDEVAELNERLQRAIESLDAALSDQELARCENAAEEGETLHIGSGVDYWKRMAESIAQAHHALLWTLLSDE